VIQGAIILATDIVFRHLDGRLDAATNMSVVRRALENLAASRPGRVLATVMKKGGVNTTMGAGPSLTLESEIVTLLKAHGLDIAGGMPGLQAVREVQGASRSYDMILSNAEKTTLRMILPQSSQQTPTSSAISTYVRDAIDAVRSLLHDTMMSVYTMLVECGESGYDILSKRVLNAGLVGQILMGSVVVLGVVVGGTYLIEVGSGGDEEDDGAGTGGVAAEDEPDVEEIDSGEVEEAEDSQSFMEQKYQQALELLVEKSNNIELLESHLGEQKELLRGLDRGLQKLKQIGEASMQEADFSRLLATQNDKIKDLYSRLSGIDSLIATKDEKIGDLGKEIAGLEKKAKERTVTINNLSSQRTRTDYEIAALKTNVSTLQQDALANKKSLTFLNSENKEQKRDIASRSEKQSSLELVIQELQKQNTNLMETVVNQRTELEEVAETVENLRTELEDGDKAFDLRLDDIDRLTNEKGNLQTELDQANETIQSLRSEDDKSKKQIDTLKKNLDCLQTASEKKDESIKKLTAKNESLAEEVSHIKEEAEGAKERCAEDDEQLAQKDDELWELRTALDKQTADSRAKDKEVATLKDAMKNLDEANIDLIAGAARSEELMDDLRTELKHTKFYHDQAIIDFNRVAKQLEESRKEVENLRTELEDVENALMDIQGLGADADDAEAEEEEEDPDKDDRAGDEAGEEDEEDRDDREDDGNGHDDHGPGNGGEGSGEGQDEPDQDKGVDHNDDKDDGDKNDGDGDDDDHGDDRPDRGADKTARGCDDTQGGEQPAAAPPTAEEVPQHPLEADGSSATIRSSSADPGQAAAPPTAPEVPQHPFEADGLSATIRSSSADPGQAAANDLPAPFPIQPQHPCIAPVKLTSGSTVRDGRALRPRRGRKTASSRARFQNNPFAGLALPGALSKQEPEVDTPTTVLPAQLSSKQDPATGQPRQSPQGESTAPILPSTAFPAPETSIVDSTPPTQDPATQAPSAAPASDQSNPSPNPSTSNPPAAETNPTPQRAEKEARQQPLTTDESIDPGQSSPTDSAFVGQAAGTETTQHGSPTDEASGPIPSSSTPTASEGKAGGTDTTQQGGPTDGSIESKQSPSSPSPPEEKVAATDSPPQDGPTDVLCESMRSTSAASAPKEQPAATNSTLNDGPADELKDTAPSSSEFPLHAHTSPRCPSAEISTSEPLPESASTSPISSTVGFKPRTQSPPTGLPASASAWSTNSSELNPVTTAFTPPVRSVLPHISLRLMAYHSM